MDALKNCPTCEHGTILDNHTHCTRCRAMNTDKRKTVATIDYSTLPACPSCGGEADPGPYIRGGPDYVECRRASCQYYTDGMTVAEWLGDEPLPSREKGWDDNEEALSAKPTNPKDGIGAAKRPLSYVPMAVLQEVGVAMMEGGLKYGAHNWREAGVLASVYFDADMRHLLDWWEGEDIDRDSGVSHLAKAIAGLMVLRDSMIEGNWIDDRPLQNSNAVSHRRGLQAVVDGLRAKYTEPVRRVTEV